MTVWVLRRVPVNETDRWDGRTYGRVLTFGETPLDVAVRQKGRILEVEIVGEHAGPKAISFVKRTLEKVLGLKVDLAAFYRIASSDERLDSLVNRFGGFRPPRMPSAFEALLNGIACQQVSLYAGIHLLNRLCKTYGPAVGNRHAFPQPEDLCRARPAELRKLGFSMSKARYIIGIARLIAAKTLDLEAMSDLSDEAVVAKLCDLSGVGRWTAQYVALRGFGRLNVFPADDIGSQNKLRQWLGMKETPDYDAIYRIINRWSPYRGLIYFYLLLQHQANLGLHTSVSG